MELIFPTPTPLSGGGVDLHAFYGDQWLEPGGVRVNFIASVDGAATAGGKSRGLQTDGDNRVFAALRDLADVVLVGASTACSEGYRPIALSEERRRKRRSLGLSELPATALVTSSLQLDLAMPLFEHAAPESPTIVVTGSSAPLNARNDVIDLAGASSAVQLVEVASTASGVSIVGAVERLRELGYRRILCEGGPRLFTAGALEGAVTELCLSISPMLVGVADTRILSGDGWPVPQSVPLELVGLLTEEHALFCRYAVLPAR